MCILSKADHVLSGLQTRKGTLKEAYEHLGRSLRHIFRDLGLWAVERDDTDDFDSAVGCRRCALLLETDEMLCGTLEVRGHHTRSNEEFNENTQSIKIRTPAHARLAASTSRPLCHDSTECTDQKVCYVLIQALG